MLISMNKVNSQFDAIKQLHQAGNLAEAKLGYLTMLVANPNDVMILHWLGILYAEEGDLAQAASTLQKAYQLDSQDTSIALHYANVLKAKQAYPEAIAILQKLLTITPQFPAIYNNLGTIYFAQGKYVEAIEAYQQAIDLQSNYADAYYNLGLGLAKSKRLPEAKHAFEALPALSPEHPGAHFQM